MASQVGRCADRETARHLRGIIAHDREGLRTYPAFFDRAGARTGFSAFLRSCTFGSSLAARLPLIGSSISRWPGAALRCFLPLAGGAAGCLPLARHRFSASLRLMPFPPDFGAGFAVGGMPLPLLFIGSVSDHS